MKRARFAVVILAGGLSTRMKQLKPLLLLGQTTVVDYVIGTFTKADVDVFLVTGYRREEIEASVKSPPAHIIFNPDYKKGMFTSVRAGIRGLKPEYQAFFILPVDIPLVSVETLKKLIVAATHNPDKVIYPVYQGKKGHPPLIPTSHIPEILAWEKDGGLKAVLESFDDRAVEVAVDDKYILFDIDTPEDYRKLLKSYQ
jgi:molybdenum cofactor cytidylyltransferase